MEFIDDNFETTTMKYVDDMTTAESIPPTAVGYDSEEGYRPTTLYHAEKTEEDIRRLNRTCEERGLKLNAKKTQLLAVSANREKTKIWVDIEGEEMKSGETLKLLGFHFHESPDVSLQIENLIPILCLTEIFSLH